MSMSDDFEHVTLSMRKARQEARHKLRQVRNKIQDAKAELAILQQEHGIMQSKIYAAQLQLDQLVNWATPGLPN